MNKKQMISAIYKKIANKELTFGCIVKPKETWKGSEWIYLTRSYGKIKENWDTKENEEIHYFKNRGSGEKRKRINGFVSQIEEIIGHQIFIGDVLKHVKNYPLIHLRNDLSSPIENQVTETIRFIYNEIFDVDNTARSA